MLVCIFLTVVSGNLFSFPISSVEKTIKIVSEQSSFNRTMKMSAFPLKEIKQEEFTVKIGLGYPPQFLNLGLNLFSKNTIISGENCDCHFSKNKYLPYKSYRFSSNYEEGNITTVSNLFKGVWANDDIIIRKQYLNNYKFLMVESDNSTNYFLSDGFLGLGRYKSSIINKLYDNNLIKKKVFSVYINDPNVIQKQSELTLGYWDPLEYAKPYKLKKLSAISREESWKVMIQHITINDLTDDSKFNITFDLTSPSIKLRNNTFDNYFLPNIPKSANCNYYTLDNQEEFLICNCSANFPTIIYQTFSTKFFIFQERYLRKEENGLCTVLIQRNYHSDIDIIGLPFFRTYYTMFDSDGYYIWFQESINYLHKSENSFLTYQSGIAISIIFTISLAGFYVKNAGKIEEHSYIRVH